MCRWITVVSSDPMSLSDVVLAPSNSLVQLSKDASFHPGFTDLNNHVTNGDGFGVGWYHRSTRRNDSTSYNRSLISISSPTQAPPPPVSTIIATKSHLNSKKVPPPLVTENSPTTSNSSAIKNNTATTSCLVKKTSSQTSSKKIAKKTKLLSAAIFKDTQPAWNNSNLRELCWAVESHCIMAHVRAASAFASTISQPNCHPFKAGPRLLFCHNGKIDQFDLVRRKFHMLLSDEAFLNVKGTTDSEIIFALLCTYLSEDRDEDGFLYCSPFQQQEAFGHERLSSALKKVLRTIERVVEEAGISTNNDDASYCTCNFALTDGETMVVTRFCDKSPAVPPPSLYFAFGDSEKLCYELTNEQLHCSRSSSSGSSSNTSTTSESTTLVDNSTGSSDDSFFNEVSTTSQSSAVFFTGSSKAKEQAEEMSSFDETMVDVEGWDSKPGTVYADVDVNKATFMVASCPLTRTHTWHTMPKNSIMWYTRGSLPELRLLKRRKTTRSIIFDTY